MNYAKAQPELVARNEVETRVLCKNQTSNADPIFHGGAKLAIPESLRISRL